MPRPGPTCLYDRLAIALLLCAGSALLQACASTLVPGQSAALWMIVDARCNQGWAPVPGIECHAERGVALVKAQCGASRYLLVPLARRTGVESPELLDDSEPDYFAQAWAERERVIAASGRAAAGSDELGLAVNSRWGRSQDQLHIHIDRVHPQVRHAIRQWQLDGATRPDIELFGHAYRIVHRTGFARPTPFQLAGAAGEPAARREGNTIAAVGDGDAGVYLLFGHADPERRDPGHAEEILLPSGCGR